MKTWCWEQPVEPVLSSHLACTWHADVGGPPRTLVPDACMDLLWTSNGLIWLCGPETSSWTFTLPPGTSAVGVRFRPAAATAVLRLDARDVGNVRVPIEDLWGSRVARALLDRVDSAASPEARIAVLTGAVQERLERAGGIDPVAAEVADRLARPDHPPDARPDAEARTVRALARDLGVSERQLHRRSVAAFGYGPSVLGRILRVQRFLAAARSAGRPTGLAEMAVAAGYSDQPHLTREVKAIAGATPAEIVRGRGFGVRSVQDQWRRAGSSWDHDRDRRPLSPHRRRVHSPARGDRVG